jgi:hypothetical protein
LVDISVAHNPLYHVIQNTNGVPSFLSGVVKIVTNKPVGAIRIYASLVVFLVSIIIAGSVLYAGVRTGMIAVGRNPLAKASIMRGLLQVVLIALIIVTSGFLAVYLLLRL